MKVKYLIPFLILVLVFGFASACSSGEVSKVEEEVVEEPIEEEAAAKEPIEPVEEEVEEPETEKEIVEAEEPTKPTSRENPAVLGETFLVLMDDWMIGEVTFEIEMIEVVSGDEAWEMVKKANQFNDKPEEGKEYILAKFRIKVIKTEEDEPYEINHAKFDVISGGGVEYTDFISVSGIEPDLRTDIYEGAEHIGWTYFMVDKDDDNPLAAFDRKGEAEIWFKLRS